MSGNTSTLRPHGDYRLLRSFQVTEIIYDGTVAFCDRFVDKRSRTHDVVQAARWAAEHRRRQPASATSSQTELRLVNVARASLDELLLDYEDFLRQRGLKQWEKDDPRRGECGRWEVGDQTERSVAPASAASCAACGKVMVIHTARNGPKAGAQFWGCLGYPNFKATLPV